MVSHGGDDKHPGTGDSIGYQRQNRLRETTYSAESAKLLEELVNLQ